MRLGADVDGVDEIATGLDRLGDSISSIRVELRQRLERTDWHGPDRVAFGERMTRDLRCFDDVLSTLSRMGDDLRHQAAQQRTASFAVASDRSATCDAVAMAADRAGEQLLTCETVGDGRLVVVEGDLTRARHVAVFVPGAGTTLWNADGPLGAARRLQVAATARRRGEVAVVMWLGYDAPTSLTDPGHLDQVLSDRRARTGATEMRRFLASMPIRTDAAVTLVGHSYGSLVAARAAHRSPSVDRVVVVGSPGVGADTVDELDLRAGTAVFAGANRADPVARSGWFSTPPTDDHFGATVFVTEGAWSNPLRAHSSYFDRDSPSLEAIASIVVGETPARR
ncbi:MAG: alpha/beta fold hydrolase [Microthrixaceae bacterium]